MEWKLAFRFGIESDFEMSIGFPQAEASNTPQLPMPPSAGWTPMEMLEAYYPEEMRLWREAGPEFDDSLDIPWYEQLGRTRARDVWLLRLFCSLISQRDDLIVTGNNLELRLYASRSTLPRQLFVTAYNSDGTERDTKNGRDLLFKFDILAETVTVLYWTGTEKKSRQSGGMRLVALWIESAAPEDGRTNLLLPSNREASPAAVKAKSRARVKDAEIERWLRDRVETRPVGLPPPTGPECLDDAKDHFGCAIGRDRFYDIRNRIVPEPWRRPGPRR